MATDDGRGSQRDYGGSPGSGGAGAGRGSSPGGPTGGSSSSGSSGSREAGNAADRGSVSGYSGSSSSSGGRDSGGAGPGRGSSMGGPSISGSGSIGSSGSREAGISADRNSVSGYSGSGSITSAGSRAAGVAADRNSVSGYSSGGLYSAANNTPSYRAAEIASMKAYDDYRATDLASQRRAAENQSMYDLAIHNVMEGIHGIETPVSSYPDPYNTLVGGTTANLTGMTVAEVQELQKQMLAQGFPTTALGKFQTIAATLNGLVEKTGINPATTMFDEKTQDMLQKALVEENIGILQERGVPVTPGSLYAAHLMGPNTAANVFGANPNASVKSVVGAKAASNNPSLLGGKTVAQTISAIESKMASIPGYTANNLVGAPGKPTSLVANNDRFPATTSAVPTTRASFGEKFLGDGMVEKGGFFPGSIAAVPTSRPSPVASAFTGRPDVPVGSLPAARMGTTVAGRPDVPVGSLPAARAATTIAGRPDVPVGALPAARDVLASNFPARPAGPATGLPAARFEDKYLSPQSLTDGGMVSAPAPARGPVGDGLTSGPVGSGVASGTSFAGGPAQSLSAAPVGAVERGLSLSAPSPSRPDNLAASGPKGNFSVSAPGRSASPENPGQIGGISMSNPVGLGGPGGLYVGGQPTIQEDRIAKGRADEAAYAQYEASRGKGFSQIAERQKSTSQQIGEGLFGDEDTYVDDESVPIADLPEHPSAPRPAGTPGAKTPTVAEKPAEVDSIPEKVLAGGLDILGGMVPGVGMGVGIVNAGLAITGNKTIGQRIADYIFDGNNQYQPGSTSQRSERGDGMASEWFKGKRFADKYLKPEEAEEPTMPPWVETTGRPTPKERYIDNRDNYAG